MEKKPENHYVDNKKLYQEFIDYKEKKKSNPDLKPNNFICQSIIDIAENMGKSFNFRGYTYLEDMIADGIENAIRYVDNFNPHSSKNPYGYFSMVIHRAFVRRIRKEKKQAYVRYASIAYGNMEDFVDGDAGINESVIQESRDVMISDKDIEEFEKNSPQKKRIEKRNKNDAKKSVIDDFSE